MKRFMDEMYSPRFEADGGADGGNAGGDEGGGNGGEGAGTDEGDGKDKRVVTMSQADLDALIQREKGRVSKKFADYDELKTRLTTFEQAEEDRKKAAMSEQERLQAEKDEALKKAQEAEGKAQSTLDAANQRLIKAEFRAQARELGIRADALDDAFKLADLSAVSVDDEGNAAGVKDVVAALLTNKPYLAEVAPKKPKDIGGPSNPNPDMTSKTAEQALKDAAEKARASGRLEDIMAYSALKAELSKA